VSVLRYGYPFHAVDAAFDEQTRTFSIVSGLPVPVFPIEGITTRLAQGPPDAKYERWFLETSSPGLRGQSGGPVVDTDGTVWAIQSRTAHLPLGFNPRVKIGNAEIEEHQFLNVGMGADSRTIKEFLDHHGVSYNTR
jgi:S1-C subfamily serine protease